MKAIAIAFAIGATCVPPLVANFSQRVAEAKQLTGTSQGAKYDASLGPHIGAAMRACIPVGSTDQANLGSFTLVGTVDASGTLQQVEVQPASKVASCFAAQLARERLPMPPSLEREVAYPVVVEMKVGP